jgi:RNA recognition motif-containing protein
VAASASSDPSSSSAAPRASEARPKEAPKVIDPLTVVIFNISWSVPEEQFELDFSEHGEIDNVRFISDRGLAFVTYEEEAGATAALKMDGDEYWGRIIKVNRKTDRVAKVDFEAIAKGLPAAIKDEEVRSHFAGCGEIESMKVPRADDGKAKGVAWIIFTTEEALDKAVALNATELSGAPITVAKGDRCQAKTDSKFEIFVKGLPTRPEAKEEDIRKHFESCGELLAVKMKKNPEGEFTGTAYINFKTEDAMDKAIELDGKPFGECKNDLVIEQARQSKGKDKGKGKGKDKGKGKGKDKGKGKGKGKSKGKR